MQKPLNKCYDKLLHCLKPSPVSTPEDMSEGWEKDFDQRYIYGAFGIDYVGQHVPFAALKEFISSLLSARDAHHAALRAKELGQLRDKLESRDYYWQRDHQERTLISLDDALSALDELIEKPTT